MEVIQMHPVDNNFLFQEYTESYKQLRFYDERNISLVKFSISISSIVATLLLGLYKLFKDDSMVFWAALLSISILVFLCLTIVLFILTQNRLYFVFMAKQLNALRKHLLASSPEFTNNQLYTTTSFSAYKRYSAHLMIIYGISLVSSAYFSLAIFSASKYTSYETPLLCIVIAGIIVSIIQIISCALYLKINGSKSSDEAIHSSK